MPVLPTPTDMVARWKAGVQLGGARYAAGINNTAVNPMQLAVQQQQKMLNNWNNAVNSGRWAQRTGNTPVSFWKSQATLAQAKYSQGATTGESRYTTFANKAPAVYQAMRTAVANGAQDPVSKVTAALNVIIAAGRKSGGTGFQ